MYWRNCANEPIQHDYELGEGAVTLEDLAEFSEEVRERVRFLVGR